MLMTIYKRAFAVLMKKPLKLWGISLLSIVLSFALNALCGVAIPVLGLSVSLLLSTSMTIIYLRGYRGEQVSTTQLFECFANWSTIKRVVLGMGWMALWIFLWALIPIVGPIFAIIRVYRYRLTPYILVFEPDVSITDAIKVSEYRTHGYKLQMWLADFVFALICAGVVIVLTLLTMIPILGILFGLVLFLFYIAIVALSPLFVGLVRAAFYEEINNKFASVTYCATCNSPLSPDAAFCPTCGNPVQ